MNLIVETDIGRDPDDFFAICYFIMAGVDIRAITISPGDQDQVAVAKLILDEVGLDIPVGSAHPERTKNSSNEAHLKMIRKYGGAQRRPADGVGCDIIESTIAKYPDCELFICGPMENVGDYLRKAGSCPFKNVTVQGGFIGYDVHGQTVERLEKFEGKTTVPTFNLNGDVRSALLLLEQPNLKRRFVSKNVCHTILYDKNVHQRVVQANRPGIAAKLFRQFMDSYLQNQPVKAFHDPSAAVCHLHPDTATWFPGKLYREKGGWGTLPDNGGDEIIIDINREKLWAHIIQGD
jgi:pyrimidine-specific ribonucleoside hydrolase